MRRSIHTLLRAGLMVAGLLTMRASSQAQITVTIAGNPSTSGNVPLGSSNYHAGEHIYLASEIGTDMTIHHINFNMTTFTAGQSSYGNVALYLKTTATATLLTGTYSLAGYTPVYSGTMAFTGAGFAGVDLTTPFIYTLASGNLELLLIRTDNVTHVGPVFATANGNSGNAALTTSRRYNGTGAPAAGVTGLTASNFRAAVQFIQYAVCTDPPTPGTTVATVNPVCTGATTTLSLTGGTSGLGQTYQWLEDGVNAPGASTSATYVATITAPHSYSCIVTCGLNSATSSSLPVGLNTTGFPEDFTSAAFPPNCFTQVGANTLLLRSTANGNAAPGTGSAQWNFYNAANLTVLTLTSPTFAPFGTPMQFNFVGSGGTYTGGEVDHIFVEASSDGGVTWPTLLADLDNAPGTGELSQGGAALPAWTPTLAAHWAPFSYIISGTVNRVRFRGVSNFGNMCYIDNLSITAPPACIAPDNVSVSNITATGADVSWNCPGCTGSYIIEYGAPGFVPGTAGTPGVGGTIVTAASSPASIAGLTATTGYDVHVRQNCGSGIYSLNSAATNFLSGCSGSSCSYSFHLTDNFSDGWNGGIVQVRQNGFTVATLGPQVLTCDATVAVNICASTSLTLVCTNIGTFPDEPGLTMTDPFGTIVFEQRGTTLYPGNCAITYPNPGTLSDLALGTMFSTTGNCTPPPCTDPPVAGTISGTALVCSGTNTVLSMSNPLASGLGRQWQQSSTGSAGSWTSIGGANAQSYTTPNLTSDTYYRFYLDCGAGSDTSAAYLVDVSIPACYCTPVHPFSCGNGNITNVSLNTLNNTSTCAPPAYQSYDPGVATTTVQQGVSYNLGVTTDQSCIISVWVDWDHDNIFAPSEWTQVSLSSTAGTAAVVGVPVPLGAVLGQTAMRIRSRFSGNPNTATDACSSFGSGESEDYVITVAPAPPCLPATAVTITNPTATSFDVNWTNGVNSCGSALYTIEYGAIGFVQGTGTSLPPVAGGPVTVSGLTPGTAYHVYVTRDCTPCGDGPGPSTLATGVTYPDCAAAQVINCPFGTGSFGPNGPGAWNFVEPLFNFTTSGAEQLFFLNASVLGTYTMSLTASVGSSIVAIYIKPVGTCGPTGWTYVGTNQFTVQSFTFPIAATGQYWILVDPVSSSLPVQDYLVTFVCPPQNIDCASAQPLSCGSVATSTTAGVLNSLPVNACPFPVAPSTGGVSWYSYTTPGADEEVTLSTCSSASFDTRLSVFEGPNCGSLCCKAFNDDIAGCTGFTSERTFLAEQGQTYYIVVHGFGAAEGIFTLSVSCAPPCAPGTTNDVCSSASPLTAVLSDGSGVAATGDNTCAYSDPNTSCDPFGGMQGVWYTFNTGSHTSFDLSLLTNAQNIVYTSTDISYALYTGCATGTCAQGGSGELACNVVGEGTNTLSGLTPNTDYVLHVWNDGGVGVEGTFGILLEYPADNDASIVSSTLSPSGTVCGSLLQPIVELQNLGFQTLTSVTITYDFDGGTPVLYSWTGNLATGATEIVILPQSSVLSGSHTLNVSTSNPNGVADEVPANDAASGAFSNDGEPVVVVIRTDDYPEEVTWEIFDGLGFSQATGGPYTGQPNVVINTTVCLGSTFGNCYNMKLYDAFGDGICCLNGAGYWELRTLSDQLLLRDRFEDPTGNSGGDGSISPDSPPASGSYPDGHEFCVPKGPSDIQAGECDILTNTLQSKVYTTPVSGISNYQFEFSDPDQGFRRRIAVPRNWVKFGEMVTNPLVPGTIYFARVRVDMGSGFAGERFGAGCEMALDAALIPGCTQLIDDTNLPTHSCGVTKTFGGSDKIWAQPVVGATQYRFHFVNLGEGYVRNINRNNYVCPLSWVTLPLVNGSTYDVTVESMVNGVWGGFCGAMCQVTILNPPGQGRIVAEAPTNTLQLYPNPLREGNLTILLDGLINAQHQVRIEMVDLYGRTVLSKAMSVDGSVLNTTLEVPRNVAAGAYQVNILVDGSLFSRRLVVD